MINGIVLSLKHGENNPRNSEGAFIALNDGRILFAYSRYYGKSWADYASAEIAARYSADGGRTWTDKDRLLVKKEGGLNVMSVSLLRLQDGRIALFYLKKTSPADCRLYRQASQDEGKTWGTARCCLPAAGYFVVNNDRVIQLKTGRLIAPAAFHRCRLDDLHAGNPSYEDFDHRGIAVFFLSDDSGRTWRESKDWRAIPARSSSGLQEPGVIELKDDRLYAWYRTDQGCQYENFSEDGGETWSAPKPSAFKSPCSPLSIKRIPATGELLAVWNDYSGRWKLPRPQKKSWGRTPLAMAISANDGKTWRNARLIEKDAGRGFCYTAIHFTQDGVLLAYCCGGRKSAVLQDLCVRKISLSGRG